MCIKSEQNPTPDNSESEKVQFVEHYSTSEDGQAALSACRVSSDMTLVLPMTGFHRLPCRDTPGSTGGNVLGGGNRLLSGWGEQASSQDSTSKTSLPTPRELLCSRLTHKQTIDSSLDVSAISAGGRHGPTSAAVSYKRKLDPDEDGDEMPENRPKRISAMWNTPKQRRDDRRKVLRISVHKLRQIDDPEHFLRRSVLINNTMKRMQKEIRDEKCHGYGHFYPVELAPGRPYTTPSFEPRETLPRRKASPLYHHSREGRGTSYLSANAHLFDDVYTQTDDCDRITDDMTDRLVRSLEQTTADCTSGDVRDRSTNVTQNNASEDATNNNNNNYSTNSTSKLSDFSHLGKLNNNNIKTASCSINERQLLGDIDAVFNNLICALSSDT